jgi:putative membrane protein
MLNFWSHLTGTAVIAVLSAISLLLFAHFLWQYVFRGIRLRRQLKDLAQKVGALSDRSPDLLRSDLDTIFAGTQAKHAWTEYADTLHEQSENFEGALRITAVRATVSADAFINLESTVDPRIGTEYFRHLPGLFTGLGIIGTFSGLIAGLIAFKPDAEVEALKVGLGGLFQHVQGAFYFSAVAISLAMLVTLIEKWLYSSCAKWIGEITVGLDGLFKAGVGEEYLSNLLRSSQDNATQTKQLKESMVDDLKVLLTNLTERQIQASQQMSIDIGQHIEASLKEPLSSLADTVRQASGQQATAASNVLENLMAAVIAQMKESLGGQMGDLSALMQQTAESLSSVEASMRSLIEDMRRTSSESTSGMQATVQGLITAMTEHQRDQSVAVKGSTDGLLERVEQTIKDLAIHQEAMDKRTEANVSSVVAAMSERVDALAAANKETHESTSNTIDALGKVSTETIHGLAAGASAVATAVASVQQATDRLGQLTQRLGEMQANLISSSDQMTNSVKVLGSASQALNTTSTTMGTAATRLEAVANSAMVEAEARGKLLVDLKAMTEQSRNAGQELASLSEGVAQHLVKNVEQFGGSVGNVLRQHLSDYQKQLAEAVGMLKDAMDQLAETLDREDN